MKRIGSIFLALAMLSACCHRQPAASPSYIVQVSLWDLGKVTTITATGMDYCTPEVLEEKIQAAVREGLDIVANAME